jgi:integrase
VKGSLSERRPGVWELRVFTGRRDAKDNPVQRSRTFHGGRRQAENALRDFVKEITGQRLEDTGSGVTVARLLDRWLVHCKPARTPMTFRDYQGKVERRLKPALGDIRLDKLRATHIDRAMTDWRDDGLSAASIRGLYAILAAALHQAYKWGWVDEIATKKATPPSVRRKQATVPTPRQLRDLIITAEARRDGGVLAAAIALAAATGCRRGELCALRWSDIDLTTGTVTVGRSLGYVESRVVEGDTKTHQVRRLALDEFGVSVVRARIEAQRATAEAVGVELHADPYLLSRAVRGDQPCLPDGLTHGFAQTAKAAGVDFHFHQLRHFVASWALANGYDVRTVAGRLGHADASTTLKVYAHVIAARDQDLAKGLGGVLAPPSSGVSSPQ